MNATTPRATTNAESADDRVQLVGLDFGSTTSRAAAASARLLRDAKTGRVELGEISITYRSPVVFTPFSGNQIDLERTHEYLNDWLAHAALDPARLLGGGTLLTGLAARSSNAAALAELVRKRLGSGVLTTAADPCLESWVAFMASCAKLSAAHPSRTFVNFDIGGGTTNVALGRDGIVKQTFALRVGARHIQVRPGSHEVTALSTLGAAHLGAHGIDRRIGDCLRREEVATIVNCQVRLLEAVVCGDREFLARPCAALHQETPLPRFNHSDGESIIHTFTGGVGDLVYRILHDEPLLELTAYGDLGIELAQAIARSPILVRSDTLRYVPAERGHATVYGMLLHGTEVSGTTLYLPRPQLLPLPDLPILARLSQHSTQEDVDAALQLARGCRFGACLHVSAGCATLQEVRTLAAKLRATLVRSDFPTELPLVFILRDNTGKLFGHYLTDWGRLDHNIVVIDEVAEREMSFVSIGALHAQVVPVSFYGMTRSKRSSHA